MDLLVAAGGRPKAARGSRGSKDVQAIRDWAAANGHEVASRGRIPANAVEAYEAR